MKKKDLLYLDHILQSLRKITIYIENISYDDFLNDEEKQDAVIRKIEIVGEATKRLSKDLRQEFNDIPWRAMAGMRDKLIHDYFDVDLETVWETATIDILKLIPNITTIIRKLEG